MVDILCTLGLGMGIQTHDLGVFHSAKPIGLDNNHAFESIKMSLQHLVLKPMTITLFAIARDNL